MLAKSMSKDLKWCKQFIKCSSLSWHHKRKRESTRERIEQAMELGKEIVYFNLERNE
jgi:hypothetical protein